MNVEVPVAEEAPAVCAWSEKLVVILPLEICSHHVAQFRVTCKQETVDGAVVDATVLTRNRNKVIT